jgi:hypothetical protein
MVRVTRCPARHDRSPTPSLRCRPPGAIRHANRKAPEVAWASEGMLRVSEAVASIRLRPARAVVDNHDVRGFEFEAIRFIRVGTMVLSVIWDRRSERCSDRG